MADSIERRCAVHFTSPAVASWPRLVVLLLLATITFAPGVEAAPVWRTSGDLLAAAPARVTRLDAAGIEAVIARLPGSLSLIRDYLRDRNVRVHLHTGDLTIDGSFANTHALVVDGNLTIRGSYDDYRGGGIGILVVLGDLRAEHVVSWGSMAVTGALHASGLVYAYYNDFTFEVAGPVRARAVVVFDKSTNDPRVEATVRQTDDGDGAALAVRHFVPELMVDDILDKTEADTQQLQAVASYDAAQDRIAAGLPIFRAQPGADSLPGDILRLFAPGLDAATRARLARADPLLALIVERMRARPPR